MRRLLPAGALRAGLLPRLLFLVVLGGGLLWWSELRKPRELHVAVDLTGVLPGDVREVDVVVSRGGHALARHDVSYGAGGAPGMIEIVLHAAPGDADVETTLRYEGKPAHRSLSRVRLVADRQVQVRAE
jgi:hypothetical protein